MEAHVQSLPENIPLGLYLWLRIRQIGIGTVLGVPGDFNLELLDHIYNVPGLRFVGNANELNAAYAADGYGRINGTPGVFVTTHGVGELSAVNGVSGSLCERVKVIHVVGQTPRPLQQAKAMIHHSIGDQPDHQLYNKVSKPIRLTAAELWDVENAPAEIDRVIRECVISCGPVYIFMPIDMSSEPVPSSLLSTPIDFSPPIDSDAQNRAVEAIVGALREARSPCLFVDALVQRYDAREDCAALAKRLRVPVYSTHMGKATVDETEEFYAGIYHGQVDDKAICEGIESSDCVLVLGSVNADTNSGGFTRKIRKDAEVQINPNNVVVKGERYDGIAIKQVLSLLEDALQGVEVARVKPPQVLPKPLPVDHAAKNLTQSWIWSRIAAFLKPHDVVMAETGTTLFGLTPERMPSDVRFVSQAYYGSIGYIFAASLGIELSLEDSHHEKGTPRGRTVCVTGDGSMALTIQEVGTMISQGLKPVVVVLNNKGYTVERVIHGALQPYNTTPKTNYSHLLPLFAHPQADQCFHKAVTKEEFVKVFEKAELADPQVTHLVELVLDAMDSPWRLTKQLAMRGEAGVKYLTDVGFIGPGKVGIGG
ncbi:pyruvate decarboxylase isoenzyme [Trichodelitschia bisporula]|uniref:Pyruvate decarboxylase n=1 Tax=Trichodelitschia bisporula TaxID=703511 RepID=A0A6G1HWL0_9PEZI|nr:pyruvate decarboxylase isoenzyme [Trichodelitschia bisporula]